MAPGNELSASCVLSKHSATELDAQPHDDIDFFEWPRSAVAGVW